MFGKKDKNKKLKIKKEPTLWDTMKNDTMKGKTKKKKLTALEKAMKEAGML
tara:strand:+ start:164 stop:316 length:153 start_codon:yes stop_codon:yes gene_type:complete